MTHRERDSRRTRPLIDELYSLIGGGKRGFPLAGGASPVLDSSSLYRTDPTDITWTLLGSAPPVMANDQIGLSPAGAIVNPYANAPANSFLGGIVAVPPGSGGLLVKGIMRRSATLGNPPATAVLAFFDITGAILLASTVCVLTTTRTTFSVNLPSAVVGTQYQWKLIVNNPGLGSSVQAQFECDGVFITSPGATGVLGGPFTRLGATPGTVLDNLERSTLINVGYVMSASSRTVINTTANVLVVEYFATVFSSSNAEANIGIEVGGSAFATIIPTGTGVQFATIPLPPGYKQVNVINGQTALPEAQMLCAPVRALYVGSNDSISLVGPQAGRRMVTDGDSISVGSLSTNPPFRGYAQLLRKRVPNVTLSGYSTRFLTDDYTSVGSSTNRVIYMSADGIPTDFLQALGTNDYGGFTNPPTCTASQFQGFYTNCLNAAHAQWPTANLFAMTPLQRIGESTPNINGDTLASFRNAIAAAINALAYTVHIIPGPDIIPQSDLVVPGGLHPDDAGHDKIFRYVSSQTGYGGATISAWVNPDTTSLVEEWAAHVLASISLDGSGNVQSWTGVFNGNVVSQATPGFRPVWTPNNGYNALPAINFNGVNTFLDMPSAIVGASPWTLILVFQSTVSGGGGAVAPFHVGINDGMAMSLNGSRTMAYDGPPTAVDGVYTANTAEIWAWTNDGVTVKFYLNSVNQVITNSGTQPNAPSAKTAFGRFSGAGGALYFPGTVQHALVYNVSKSASQITTICTALAQRYGLPPA